MGSFKEVEGDVVEKMSPVRETEENRKTANNEWTSTVDASILHECRYFVYTGPPILARCSLLIL